MFFFSYSKCCLSLAVRKRRQEVFALAYHNEGAGRGLYDVRRGTHLLKTMVMAIEKIREFKLNSSIAVSGFDTPADRFFTRVIIKRYIDYTQFDNFLHVR